MARGSETQFQVGETFKLLNAWQPILTINTHIMVWSMFVFDGSSFIESLPKTKPCEIKLKSHPMGHKVFISRDENTANVPVQIVFINSIIQRLCVYCWNK